MSLSALMTSLTEFVGDVLVNECRRPVPDRVLRYHGMLPHDCCTANGFLAINWQTVYPSGTFPASATGDPCAGLPATELRLRYVVCWPAPEYGDAGVITTTPAQDTQWDGITAMLADVSECVFRALLNLQCGTDPDPYTAAVRAQLAAGRIRVIEATPILPLGLCAGVQWRLYCAPAAGMPAS